MSLCDTVPGWEVLVLCSTWSGVSWCDRVPESECLCMIQYLEGSVLVLYSIWMGVSLCVTVPGGECLSLTQY